MNTFTVIVRTATGPKPVTWMAYSSAEAGEEVASFFDEPCGITVRPGGR